MEFSHSLAHLFVILLCLTRAAAHGALNRPAPRNNYKNASFQTIPGCAGSACWWYSIGCINGCNCTGTGKAASYTAPEDVGCTSPMEPTLNDPELRTWNIEGISKFGDFTKYFPWRAPGHSVPLDPCGMAGARPASVPSGPGLPTGTPYKAGFPGSQLPSLDGRATVWPAGGLAWVSFSYDVNHGGGYQYRLCPKSKVPTNECFEQMPLEFASNEHRIIWEDGWKPHTYVPAVDVSQGTKPVGSTWRRHPVPACNCDFGEDCGSWKPHLRPGAYTYDAYETQELPSWYTANRSRYDPKCSTGFQFPPPAEGVVGFTTVGLNKLSVGDQLKVPSEEGQYLLQWRWDCEQSAQIWGSCADVIIAKDESVVV